MFSSPCSMLTSQHGSQWTWNSYLLWIVQRINWNSHGFVKFVSIRFFMNCWNMSKSSQLISSPFPIFSSRPRFTRALPCPGCWTAEEACHETKQARVLLLGPAFSDSQRVAGGTTSGPLLLISERQQPRTNNHLWLFFIVDEPLWLG